MANSKRKRPNRKGRAMRSSMRRLHQAVHESAVMIRPPSDPPSIHPFRTFTIVSQFMIAKAETAAITPSTIPKDHVIGVVISKNHTSPYVKLDSSHIRKAWLFSMGHSADVGVDAWEFAIVKACIWGPTPQQISASVEFSVCNGTAIKACVDHGSPTARPRVGIGFPKLTFGSGQQYVEFRIVCNTVGNLVDGSIIGILHLTIAGRPKGALNV